MKKFGSTLFLFFPFALLMYCMLVCASGNYLPEHLHPNLTYRVGYAGHSFSRFKELKDKKKIDILFVGSSHAYRGFDPRLFKDFQTFNIGSSSQTPIQSEMLLQRYVDSIHPKCVIYEVYPLTFTIDGVESATDLIANDKNDFYSMEMALKTNKIKVYNSLIYGFFNDAFHRNVNFNEPRKKYNDTYISGGFVERKLEFFSPKGENKKGKYLFLDKQFESFYKSLAFLKKKGIKVILVQTPITKYEYQAYSNNSTFDQQMMATKLPYYNFNKLMKLSDTLHFYDKSHLNQDGVQLFNQKLINIIKWKNLGK